MKFKKCLLCLMALPLSFLFADRFGENTNLPSLPPLKDSIVDTSSYKDAYTYQKFTKLLFLPAYGFGYRQRSGNMGFDVAMNVAPYVFLNVIHARVASLFYLNKLSKTSSPYVGLGAGGFGSYSNTRKKGTFHGGITGDVLIGIENAKGFWEIDIAVSHYLDSNPKHRIFHARTFPFITISKGWRF